MKKGKLKALMLMVLLSVLSSAVMMFYVDPASAATITAKAGVGGAITPSGNVTVKDGTTQQFGIATGSGFIILGVTGCNGTLSKTSSGYIYTTGRISANCKVSASFKLNTPKLSWFKINNDAAETMDRTVALHFRTADGSMPTHYKASEGSDLSGVAWKPLSSGIFSLAYELNAGGGSKTVYLQLKDSTTGGQSNVMNDTINLQARQFYNISGHDFYTAAVSAGFVSRAVRSTSIHAYGCSCVITEGPADNLQSHQVGARVVGDSNVIGSNYANPACEFTFFEGQTLQNSFVFRSMSGVQYPIVAGCGMNGPSTLTAGSTSVRFTLQGWTGPNSACQYVIDTITLEGPANSNWRAALGLKP
jgi:hypothetical protein